MKTIKFIVEKVARGYSAYAQERAIMTEADTLQELKSDIAAALDQQCETLGTDVQQLKVVLVYDVPALFDAFNFINAKSFAQRIGMNNTLLNHYAQGVKKPGAKQKTRILEGMQAMALEMASVRLSA